MYREPLEYSLCFKCEEKPLWGISLLDQWCELLCKVVLSELTPYKVSF